MAMTAQGLADAITAAQGAAEAPAIQADANLKLATGIVAYLTANETVAVTGSVTTGVGAGGAVVGTGTVS